MTERDGAAFVAECYWPGIRRDELTSLDERVEASVSHLRREGMVRYLGSILVLEDEVVLCLFEGAEEGIRRVAEEAALPFERILVTARSPRWRGQAATDRMTRTGGRR